MNTSAKIQKCQLFQETYDNILSCDYTTKEPEFDDISEEAKDFIAHLLVIDPKKRMSAAGALDHPWLNPEAQKQPRRISMLQTSPKLFDVMSRLKWQKCTKVIVACSKFKEGATSQ